MITLEGFEQPNLKTKQLCSNTKSWGFFLATLSNESIFVLSKGILVKGFRQASYEIYSIIKTNLK